MIVPRARRSLGGRPEDLSLGWAQRAPEWSEYFGASVGEAFERTTTSALATEAEVRNRERERYGAAGPGVIQDVENVPGLYDDSLTGSVYDASSYDYKNEPVYIRQEEWNEEHPLYRPGVKWREDMTEVRAELYAEEYDERQVRQMIIERGSRNFGAVKGTAAGFVAGVVGSLPDPINIIPFGAGIGSGTLARGVGRGAVEGMLGNMAVNAVVLPDLASRGADVGFNDFIIDSAFGAVVGGLFGGAGYGARYLARRRFASPDISLENRNPINDQARNYVRGKARTDIVDSQALALDDIRSGRPVDVSPVLAESAAIREMYRQALFDPTVFKDPYNPQVRMMVSDFADNLERGLREVVLDSGQYRVVADGGIDVNSRDFGLVKIIWHHGEKSNTPAKYQVTQENIVALPRIVREYISHTAERDGVTWIVPDADGRPVMYIARNFDRVDGAHHVVSVHVLKNKSQVEKRGGYSKKIAGPASSVKGSVPLTKIPQGELTPESGRFQTSEADSHSPKGQGQQPGLASPGEPYMSSSGIPAGRLVHKNAVASGELTPSSRLSSGQDRNISTDDGIIGTTTGKVNRFATEAPDTFTRAPEHSAAEREVLEEAGIDRNTLASPEETLARQEIVAGRVLPEDAAPLAEADAALARADQVEEAGLSVLGCVMEVIE